MDTQTVPYQPGVLLRRGSIFFILSLLYDSQFRDKSTLREHHNLPTNDTLRRFGIKEGNRYKLCAETEQTLAHCIRYFTDWCYRKKNIANQYAL